MNHIHHIHQILEDCGRFVFITIYAVKAAITGKTEEE